MKKSILIFCAVVASLSLAAFGITNWKSSLIGCHIVTDADSVAIKEMPSSIVEVETKQTNHELKVDNFIYQIGNRFTRAIPLNKVLKSKSIIDMLPKDVTENRYAYTNVKVAVQPDTKKQFAFSKDEMHNSQQLELIKSFDYSTNFYINANFLYKQPNAKPAHDDFLVYYFSVVPEKQATYKEGNKDLLQHIAAQTKAEIAFVNERDLRPGRVLLEINEMGELENFRLESTCGFDYIDLKMMQIFNTLPSAWEPATNSFGKPVKQELVFFFGQVGC